MRRSLLSAVLSLSVLLSSLNRKQAFVFALTALLASAPAIAGLIDNWQESPNLEGLISLGEGGVGYYGQTFIALSDRIAQAEIAVKPHGLYDTKLRVLIVEVTPITRPDPTRKPQLNPTSVLFESAEILLPAESPGTPTNPVNFTTITVDIDGVTLVAGSTYGFLLDVFESLDGFDDSATVGANQHIYDDGVFFYYARGTNSAPGTRAERFADSTFWVAEDTGVDVRFRLSFAETPQPTLVALGPATLWIGLKNSDDQGTAFDLQAEVAITSAGQGVPVATAQTLCITGVTRNPDKATEAMIQFGSLLPVSVAPDAVFSLTIRARIGTNPNGTKCPGHSNAVGLRMYYDSTSRPSRISAQLTPEPLQDFFLHSDSSTVLFLDESEPTATTAKLKDSAGVNFARGNPWKEIGTWSMTLP